MVHKVVLAAVVAAAVGLGLVLPAPGHPGFGFDAIPRSQIAQIDVAR